MEPRLAKQKYQRHRRVIDEQEEMFYNEDAKFVRAHARAEFIARSMEGEDGEIAQDMLKEWGAVLKHCAQLHRTYGNQSAQLIDAENKIESLREKIQGLEKEVYVDTISLRFCCLFVAV